MSFTPEGGPESAAINSLNRDFSEISESLPLNSVVSVDLRDLDDKEEVAHSLSIVLRQALFLPVSQELNADSMSIVFNHEETEAGELFHLYIADRRPSRDTMIGLPGFIPDPSRGYYGVTWERGNMLMVNSSLGNPLYEKKCNPLKGKDINALELLSSLVDSRCVFVEDAVTGKRWFRNTRQTVRYFE